MAQTLEHNLRHYITQLVESVNQLNTILEVQLNERVADGVELKEENPWNPRSWFIDKELLRGYTGEIIDTGKLRWGGVRIEKMEDTMQPIVAAIYECAQQEGGKGLCYKLMKEIVDASEIPCDVPEHLSALVYHDPRPAAMDEVKNMGEDGADSTD